MKPRGQGRVLVMMKNVVFVTLLLACGSKQQAPVSNAGSAEDPPGPVTDTRTEIERRRDTACESLGPRITACAAEDAKKALAAGQIKQQQYDEITASGVQTKNTDEFIDSCRKADYSSRQIRVLEVCQQEESECEPMLACLDNLNKQ